METKTGKVLAIGYNTIYIKEDDGNLRNLYFDGLQKRVLNDVDKGTLERLKRIEFTDTEEFWNVGISFFVCCDICNKPLFRLHSERISDEVEDIDCDNCRGLVCSECFDVDEGCCKKCLRREIRLSAG